jgi:protein-S-isoprenylcysteine O-methyltransferase Ste14
MKKLMPTTYLLIALLAMLLLRFLLPGPTLIVPPWNLAGLLPAAFGVWINLAADRAIHTAGTTVKPFEEPTALITNGVYGISRNPMYLGFAAILIGAAVLLGASTPAVIVVAFVLLVDAAFIRAEEQNLQRRFGSAWTQYRSKVRRWI